MAASFFFYDLETSGIHPSESRVMQFAGIRTDEQLKPVGEPVNVYIKLAADVLPDPDAVMITGITPQQTISEGLTEAEFLKYFYDEVVQPDTTFLGFNSVRFDDEFMRYLHYRNFYDPYEWQWNNNCSRWDILDLVRMTRALRPEGIEWPFTSDGKPTNRLELLTKLNGLEHEHAHDALSDVYATIAVARLIRDKQPDLFKYLFEGRNKKVTSELVLKGEPFVYTTGRYPSEVLHTSASVLLAKHPQQDSALVYDLRHDPIPFAAMSIDELASAWRFTRDKTAVRLPVKTLKYNRCPAVAPLGVISDESTQERLQLPIATVKNNYQKLLAVREELAKKVYAVLTILDDERTVAAQTKNVTVDDRLYEGFVSNEDKKTMGALRQCEPDAIMGFEDKFKDERFIALLPLYQARNYPKTLTPDQRAAWDAHCAERLFEGGSNSRLAKYFARLSELGAQSELPQSKKFLLEELQLYGESIMPSDVAG